MALAVLYRSYGLRGGFYVFLHPRTSRGQGERYSAHGSLRLRQNEIKMVETLPCHRRRQHRLLFCGNSRRCRRTFRSTGRRTRRGRRGSGQHRDARSSPRYDRGYRGGCRRRVHSARNGLFVHSRRSAAQVRPSYVRLCRRFRILRICGAYSSRRCVGYENGVYRRGGIVGVARGVYVGARNRGNSGGWLPEFSTK